MWLHVHSLRAILGPMFAPKFSACAIHPGACLPSCAAASAPYLAGKCRASLEELELALLLQEDPEAEAEARARPPGRES